MGAIFFLSSQPKLPEITFLRIFTFSGEDLSDKVKHLVAYAILGALFWWALFLSPSRRRVALVVVLSLLYGLTDEWHQIYVPGRSFDVLDLSADAVGAALAAVALTTWIGGDRHGKEAEKG